MIRWMQADAAMASYGEQVLSVLISHGYEAYWVGGCVRDELMGRPVHDMDITTSALPEEVMNLFERTVPTGIAHGTITVLNGPYAFEITTYRVEGAYENHRRPTEVAFVRELAEDLRRRDFTMNAIARDLGGAYVDPYGGADDIQSGIIRCVGDARIRFQEDALRMVRCIRFASVLGYRIAYNTWKGLLQERGGIEYIALERIRVELEKMIAGSSPTIGLVLLKRSRLLEEARIPFIYEPDIEVVSKIDDIPSEEGIVRWALLMYACGLTGHAASSLMRKYTFSNEVREQTTALLNLDEDISAGLKDQSDLRNHWISLVLKYGQVAAKRWLLLRSVLPHIEGDSLKELMVHAWSWTESMGIYRLQELSITGRDLLMMTGHRGGPWIGGVLEHLLFKAASGVLPNERDKLLEEAKRVMITNEKG